MKTITSVIISLGFLATSPLLADAEKPNWDIGDERPTAVMDAAHRRKFYDGTFSGPVSEAYTAANCFAELVEKRLRNADFVISVRSVTSYPASALRYFSGVDKLGHLYTGEFLAVVYRQPVWRRTANGHPFRGFKYRCRCRLGVDSYLKGFFTLYTSDQEPILQVIPAGDDISGEPISGERNIFLLSKEPTGSDEPFQPYQERSRLLEERKAIEARLEILKQKLGTKGTPPSQ